MDANTFEHLVIESQDTLYRISMSMLKNEQQAQDCVHDAILKAYENIHKLREIEYFRTWLVRILINECKQSLRKQKRESCIDVEVSQLGERDNPYQSIEIGEAIDSLPQKIRLVVIMYYIEDYSVSEIKRTLNIPEGTVKSRLSKGRKILKELLK